MQNVRDPATFTESSRELAAEVRAKYIDADGEIADNDIDRVITWRGGAEELALGSEYCASADPLDRIVGIRILAQLGWSQEKTFVTESVDILIPLLDDEDLRIVSSSAFALGHRKDPRAVPYLVKLADHPSEDVRSGVVFGLLTQEAPEAIDALIKLSRDPDPDVRDWAVFGLGSQLDDVDTPEIREALFEALSDADEEVMAEAMVGLAERGDQRVVPALLKWFETEEPYGLAMEAAFLIGDPLLIPSLVKLQVKTDAKNMDDWDEEPMGGRGARWREGLDDALRRCRGEIDRRCRPLGPDGLPMEEQDPD